MASQKTAPSFAAKFQRLLAVEFLIIVSLSAFAALLEYIYYLYKGISFEGKAFIYIYILYLIVLFLRLLYHSIKIVFFPNSSK